MAKGASGGKRAQLNNYVKNGGRFPNAMAKNLGITPQQAQAQQPQQVQAPQSMSASFNAFNAMTDDDKADVISNMTKQQVPDHLSDTDFQKFIYNINLNDKPQLVDDATLAGMSGTTMYRTVNGVYNKKADISYNADQIAKQIQSGRITRTSDDGGSVYGRGLYFADSLGSSTSYGKTRGDVKKTAVVSMKLNSNAKVISHSSALSGMQAEIASGSKLGKALAKCDYDSRVSIYALSKGYNVISSGHGYYNVLNRQAITMSKTINAK